MFKKHLTLTLFCLAFMLLTTLQSLADPKIDPIKFTLKTNAGHITLNEEFEITITASYVSLNPNLVYVFEGSNAFKLKVVAPDGFQQTGGNFKDLTGTELSASKPSVSYTIKGKLTSSVEGGSFLLLRGAKNATNQSDFILVGQIKFSSFTPVEKDLNTEAQSARILISTQEYVPYMTMANLRAGLADSAKVVYINEGGRSGMFHYDHENTTSEDDSSMIIRSGAKRYIRQYDGYLNVKWFGAKGDGIADDQPAIQKAIDYLNPSSILLYKFDNSLRSGGTVYLPGGKYKISQTLILTNSVTLKGNTSKGMYSNRFVNPSTATHIICNFSNPYSFAIQTQSWASKDSDLNPVTPHRVAWNELTHWRQSDDIDRATLTITSGCKVEDLVITSKGGKDFYGGIRLCSATYAEVKNVGIYDGNVGILLDCALSVKIADCHIRTTTMGVVVSQSANGITLEHNYFNGAEYSTFSDLSVSTPIYADYDYYRPLRSALNYNSQKLSTAVYLNGALNVHLSQSNIFEGWDVGILAKSSTVTTDALYFEYIFDTAIILSYSQFTVQNMFKTAVRWLYGFDRNVHLTDFSTPNEYGSYGSVTDRNNTVQTGGYSKAYTYGKDPEPLNSSILTRDLFLTQKDLRTSINLANSTSLADSLKNNTITTAYEISGVPFFGSLFTYGGGWNSYYQSQILVSASDALPRLAFRGKGDGGANGLWSGWSEALSTSGGAMTGDLAFSAFNGYHAIRKGNGDGATYSTYNIYMQGRSGMGMMDNSGIVKGVYNYALGSWDVKDGFYINGVRLRAGTSANTATAASGAALTWFRFGLEIVN